MKLHKESHVDHGLTEAQVAHLLERFADREAFFIETTELPTELGAAPCDLFGPLVGDEPVPESEVTYMARGARAWKSRTIAVAYPRTSRKVTVIAGPHDEACDPAHHWPKQCILCEGIGKVHHACILFTAYGGPLAPREPGDLESEIEHVRGLAPSPGHFTLLADLDRKLAASRAFWSEHALITLPMNKLG